MILQPFLLTMNGPAHPDPELGEWAEGAKPEDLDKRRLGVIFIDKLCHLEKNIVENRDE